MSMSVFSQDSTSTKQNYLKVYLDCNSGCDMQYIKDHLQYVNYVRDVYTADLYINIVRENSGSNGKRYSLIFEGMDRYKGRNDTIRFFTSVDNTSDEIRQKIVRYLNIGLVSYISSTDLLKYLSVSVNLPKQENNENQATKWNNWIFRLSANGYGSGEASYKNTNIGTSFSGSRVTNDWIIDFSLSGRKNFSQYKLSDTNTYNSHTERASFSSLIVKSLSEHWSAGANININHSTYSNTFLSYSFLPGIEYNIFPYKQSTIHQMRILYSVGPKYYNYIDTTIFNKTQELLWRQNLSIAYEVMKKWGSISLSLNGGNYLHDFSKNSVSLSSNFSIRIVKGLSVNVGGNVRLIHDQLYLPKSGASLEEILTQQRALSTQFSYFMMVGLSYTFGDLFNNIVNPRFGNSGGGGGMTISFN